MKILIAPLDWGLGHTTRCIPLIHYLLQQGHQVFTASEGASALLLADNFPKLPSLPLAGYRIRYGKNKRVFTLHLLMQLPKILAAIRREHQWLVEQQELHQFDLIISDNRYGLYHATVPSVILTHQLQIRSGKGKRADAVLRKLHYRLLQRFHQCWIVDREGKDNLSGDLGHPNILPRHSRYLGWLSQFATVNQEEERISSTTAGGEPLAILILLSGPEPMRGQLEQLLLSQIPRLSGYRFVLVAGNPLAQEVPPLPPDVVYHSHLPAARLRGEIKKAVLIICRSGYSTLMDLAVMGKKALLIPTPGQTEQEYLAGNLGAKGYCYHTPQDRVDLFRDIPMALSAGAFPEMGLTDSDCMERVIDDFITNHLSRN